jgi:ABC-type branched-subunit amino acid transport system substrate-binding protein
MSKRLENKKYSELETLNREKILLEVVRCELEESKDLEEAKDRIDRLMLFVTLIEKVENGNAAEFIEAIKRLVETDPAKAAYLAMHGVEIAQKAGLE